MLKAVIFDFDGTVADSIPAIRTALNGTMRKIGFSELSHEQVVQAINGGARRLVQNVLPEGLRNNDAEIDRILAVYQDEYAKHCLDTKQAYEGIPELITRLHENGIQIGVLSNKNDELLQMLVAQVLPAKAVGAVQGVVQGKPTKPDRYLTDRICASLGGSPAESVMIGDSDVDVLTAQNAGMRHIGVTWGYRSESVLREKGATVFAHTVKELEQLLFTMIEGE